MPRTKGSKNKPKTVTADFATQIAKKQSAKETLTVEIASITANIDTLKADLKVKKTALKKAEKEATTFEAKKAKADAEYSMVAEPPNPFGQSHAIHCSEPLNPRREPFQLNEMMAQ